MLQLPKIGRAYQMTCNLTGSKYTDFNICPKCHGVLTEIYKHDGDSDFEITAVVCEDCEYRREADNYDQKETN